MSDQDPSILGPIVRVERRLFLVFSDLWVGLGRPCVVFVRACVPVGGRGAVGWGLSVLG